MTEYMNALIAQMRYIAFASIALALTFDYGIYREIGFKRLCCMIALIAAIASYNTIVDTGTAMFASAKENARTEYYTTMRSVRQAIDNGKKEASWFERNILYYLVYLLLGVCDVLAWLSDQIQRCIVVLYKVCCPVALGLAAWRSLSGIGIKFVTGTLWLCMWSIGTAIADLLIGEITIAALGKAVLSAGSSAAGAAVAGGVALGPALLVGVLIGLVVVVVSMVIFYITIPFMMYSLVTGGDLGQAAGSAMRSAVFGGAAAGLAVHRSYSNAKNKSVNIESSSAAHCNGTPDGAYPFAEADNITANTNGMMSDLADKQLAKSKARRTQT